MTMKMTKVNIPKLLGGSLVSVTNFQTVVTYK